jgi:1-acyl-sn-glycerol-3-phosphate acyltransferase
VAFHALPGGRFAAERRRDLPALAAAVVRFMGIESRRSLAALGDDTAFAAEAKKWSRSVLKWLALDLEVTGLENVDWHEPHVVVALHEGMLDPLVLMATLPGPLRFVARDELKDWPVIGPALEPSGQILLEPEEPKAAARKLLRGGRDALAAGFTPVVFAQGTLLGIEAAFEPGAFALARHAGVDIVPIVIAGTHRVYEWPFSPTVRRRQPVHVSILQPRSSTVPGELEREMRDLALSNAHAPVRRFDPDRDGWWDEYRFTISNDFPELAERIATRRRQIRPTRIATHGAETIPPVP